MLGVHRSFTGPRRKAGAQQELFTIQRGADQLSEFGVVIYLYTTDVYIYAKLERHKADHRVNKTQKEGML
jgi:hypothetical protein